MVAWYGMALRCNDLAKALGGRGIYKYGIRRGYGSQSQKIYKTEKLPKA